VKSFSWKRSQAPVADGRGDPVHALEICVGELEVALDHLEGGVAEYDLEGVGIAGIAQVVQGIGSKEGALPHF